MLAEMVSCGPDPEVHAAAIERWVEAVVIRTFSQRVLEEFAASPEESTKGPPRARYEITAMGRERLERWRVGLNRSHDRIQQFLARCDRLPGATAPASTTAAVSGLGPGP